jgi:hypothetical protein
LHWGNVELSAFYVFISIVAAAVGRLDSRSAADAFVDGMKGMILAGLLIGLAASVELILQNSLVLDTLIDHFTRLARGQSAVWVANGLMAVQMVLDVFIPSVSGKAAVSMPIIGPIGRRLDEHGDADLRDAAGVSGYRAGWLRPVDQVHPAAIRGAAGAVGWRAGVGRLDGVLKGRFHPRATHQGIPEPVRRVADPSQNFIKTRDPSRCFVERLDK